MTSLAPGGSPEGCIGQHRRTSFLLIIFRMQAFDVRADRCSRRTGRNSSADRHMAAIAVLASVRRSLPRAGRRLAAMVDNGGFRFHGAVVGSDSSHDPLAGVPGDVARAGELSAAGLSGPGGDRPALD